MNDDTVRHRAKLSSRDAFALIRALHREDKEAASRMIDAMDPEECAWTTASLARTAATWAEVVAAVNNNTVEEIIDAYLTYLERA